MKLLIFPSNFLYVWCIFASVRNLFLYLLCYLFSLSNLLVTLKVNELSTDYAVFCHIPLCPILVWWLFKVVKLMATHMRSYISCLMWCKLFVSRLLKWMLKTRIQSYWFYHLVLFGLVSDINFRNNRIIIIVWIVQLTKSHKRKKAVY